MVIYYGEKYSCKWVWGVQGIRERMRRGPERVRNTESNEISPDGLKADRGNGEVNLEERKGGEFC